MNFKDTHDLNNGMVKWPKDTDTSPSKEPECETPKFFGLAPLKPEGGSYSNDPVKPESKAFFTKEQLSHFERVNEFLLRDESWYLKDGE